MEDITSVTTAAALLAVIQLLEAEWEVKVIYERTSPRRVLMVLVRRQSSE